MFSTGPSLSLRSVVKNEYEWPWPRQERKPLGLIYSEQDGEWQETMRLKSKHEGVTEDLLGHVKDLELYTRTVGNHQRVMYVLVYFFLKKIALTLCRE